MIRSQLNGGNLFVQDFPVNVVFRFVLGCKTISEPSLAKYQILIIVLQAHVSQLYPVIFHTIFTLIYFLSTVFLIFTFNRSNNMIGNFCLCLVSLQG